MPAIPNDKREEALERAVVLVAKGFSAPRDMIKNGVTTDWDTAKSYIAIAQRRIRNRYKELNYDKMRKKELASLQQLEKDLWQAHSLAVEKKDVKGIGLIARAIKDVKERVAAMIGLDAPKVNTNLNVNADAKDVKHVQLTQEQANLIATKVLRLNGELPNQSEPVGADAVQEVRGSEVTPALRTALPDAPHAEPSATDAPGDAGAPGSASAGDSSPA